MSFARFGENCSDVYLHPHAGGWYECCGCSLNENRSSKFWDIEDYFGHLVDHVQAGDWVPWEAVESILEWYAGEMKEKDES